MKSMQHPYYCLYLLKPSKPDIHLNNSQKLSSYLTENTAFHCKHKSIFRKITFPGDEAGGCEAADTTFPPSADVKNEWN